MCLRKRGFKHVHTYLSFDWLKSKLCSNSCHKKGYFFMDFNMHALQKLSSACNFVLLANYATFCSIC